MNTEEACTILNGYYLHIEEYTEKYDWDMDLDSDYCRIRDIKPNWSKLKNHIVIEDDKLIGVYAYYYSPRVDMNDKVESIKGLIHFENPEPDVFNVSAWGVRYDEKVTYTVSFEKTDDDKPIQEYNSEILFL